jgi:hypothetical protein
MNGAIGSAKRTLSTAGLSRSAALATSGLWKAPETLSRIARRAPRAGDRARWSPPGSPSPAPALLDRLVFARDDDLPGAVVVGRPDAEDLAAEQLHLLVLKPEDGRHGAGPQLRRFGHGEAALADETDRLAGPQRAHGGEGCELAHRVPDHDVRRDPALAQRGENREAGGHQRRLLHLRVYELLERRLEAEPFEVEPRGLASYAVDLTGGGNGLRDVASHPRLQGPLAWKAKGYFRHRVSS